MKKVFFILFIFYSSLQIAEAQQTQEWVKRFNWNNYSEGKSIQLDSSANVYVLMRLGNPTTIDDYGLAKYSPLGNLLWGVNYNSPGNLNDQPVSFVVSKTGDAYITGMVSDQFESHMLTVKFNSSGVLQWARVYNGGLQGEGPNDIKMDNSGNIVIAGNIAVGNDSIKAFTIKYSPIGDTLWVKRFNQLPDDSQTSQLVIDDSDNVYIACYYGYHFNLPDYLILKYNSNGVLQWYKTYDSPQHYQDLGSCIDLDNIGNIYVVGTTQVPAGSGHNNILIKLNSNGILQWERVFRGILSGNGNGGYLLAGIAVSSDNNSIYYTTLCGSAVANTEIVTIKYTSSGDSVWVKRYFGGVNGVSNYPNELKLDKDDNIYVTGKGNRPTSGDDFVTIKYLPDGTQQWLATYNGPLTNSFDGASGIAIDDDYNVYVTGISSRYNGPPNILWDAVTIKYSQVLGIVTNNNEIPKSYSLSQNYPNPFNPSTNIRYQIVNSGNVKLSVFDITGREAATLVNEKQSSGTYEVTFDAQNFASGIYFYELSTDEYTQTRKMVLLK